MQVLNPDPWVGLHGWEILIIGCPVIVPVWDSIATVLKARTARQG